MNPVFWLLVIVICFLVWFLLRKLFIKIGSFIVDKYDETKNILNDKENEEEEKDE